MVGVTESNQFQKAPKLVENDIFGNMVHGRNKVIYLVSSVKHFCCRTVQGQ